MKITEVMQHVLKILKYAVVLFLLAVGTVSCHKESIPIVNTSAVSSITRTTAESGGKVTDDGGDEVMSRGVCWSKAHNPTDTSSMTSDGAGTGSFTSSLAGLTPGTIYFVRAYAVNSEGTAYGNEVSFTSSPIVQAELTTTAASSVTSSSAVSGGSITSDGGGTITARGVCWSSATNPTVSLDTTLDGTGTGTFSSNITGLSPATRYYVRAYATNNAGTAYGNEINFATEPELPKLTTAEISSRTAFSAHSGGNITSDGGASVTERGVCWNTSANPTYEINISKTTNGTGTGPFTSDLNDLSPNTSYYVRAYAKNSVGIGYGNQQTFSTKDGTATITTNGITGRQATSVVCGGSITDDGGAPIAARGVCWNTSPEPTIGIHHTTDGSGTGNFSSSISNLSPNTTYYVRAYATNILKTTYGNPQTFKTKDGTAIVTTAAITDRKAKSAMGGGRVSDDGGSSVTERGICWGLSHNPTTTGGSKASAGSGTGGFTAALTPLVPNTTYYVRAYAENYYGTWYGNEETFTTYAAEDIDGNVYNSVTIGTQVWMKENLKTTRFNNGDAIPLVTGKNEWTALTTPGYCWYDNDATTYKNPYGALYNWFAVQKGNLCPVGWHVPTHPEWTTLTDFLGGIYVAGGELKEEGTVHWLSPNTGATNRTLFTAIGGGARNHDGLFVQFGVYGNWWTSSLDVPAWSWYRYIAYNDVYVGVNHYHQPAGMSVRCVKD
jgi:uncharacterized protein (TIGR02145 family)